MAFDVVIIPDFAGAAPARFEALTLTCIAAWRENAGAAKDYPIHVAAIGEPPASVRWLADKLDVSVTVHDTYDPLHVWKNKFRGLELDYLCDRVLVLDADVLAMSDASGLAGLEGDLLVGTASVPRTPDRIWKDIYAGLGMDLPDEEMPCVMQEWSWGWGEHTAVRDEEGNRHSARPYFNAGVILVKRDMVEKLHARWLEHIDRIGELLDLDPFYHHEVVISDQPGLTTAVQSLIPEGVTFRRLPEAYNARWHHLFVRCLPRNEIKLFHAFRLAENPIPASRSIKWSLYLYPYLLWYRLLLLMVRERRKLKRLPSVTRQVLPAMWDAYQLAARIRPLYRKHIGPALRAGRVESSRAV